MYEAKFRSRPWRGGEAEIPHPVRATRFRLLLLEKSQKFKRSNLFLTRDLFKDQYFLSVCVNIQNSCYSLTGGPWGRGSLSDMPDYFKWCDVCYLEPASSFTAPPRTGHGLLSVVQGAEVLPREHHTLAGRWEAGLEQSLTSSITAGQQFQVNNYLCAFAPEMLIFSLSIIFHWGTLSVSSGQDWVYLTLLSSRTGSLLCRKWWYYCFYKGSTGLAVLLISEKIWLIQILWLLQFSDDPLL